MPLPKKSPEFYSVEMNGGGVTLCYQGPGVASYIWMDMAKWTKLVRETGKYTPKYRPKRADNKEPAQ